MTGNNTNYAQVIFEGNDMIPVPSMDHPLYLSLIVTDVPIPEDEFDGLKIETRVFDATALRDPEQLSQILAAMHVVMTNTLKTADH